MKCVHRQGSALSGSIQDVSLDLPPGSWAANGLCVEGPLGLHAGDVAQPCLDVRRATPSGRIPKSQLLRRTLGS